jgi:hypothetical protein
MPNVSKKFFRLKDLETSEAGSLTALFAPYLSVDRQKDVTLPGAFGDQQVLISAYGHTSWDGALPVGKGRIYDGVAGGEFEGAFFLDTFSGLETYKTVKNVGDLQEFSYSLPEIESELRGLRELQREYPALRLNGHDPTETVRVLKKIRVNEISPVLLGAGIGTRTISIKGCGACGDRCSRLTGGACCIEDAAEVLGRTSDLLARLNLKRELERSETSRGLRHEIARFKAIEARTHDLVYEHFIHIPPENVDPALRAAAEKHLTWAWEAQGAPWPVHIQWVVEEPAWMAERARATGSRSYKTEFALATGPVRGMADSYEEQIFLNADRVKLQTVASTVAHELRHLLQDRRMDREASEADARAFASEYVYSTL